MPIHTSSAARRRACLAWLLAAGIGACADSRQEAVLARLIPSDHESAATPDPRTAFTLKTTWDMRTDRPGAVAAWSFYVPDAPATLAPAGGGIDLRPLLESRYLVWTGSLGAGDVEVLRFRFREPLDSPVELYWNGPGEDFAPQRYLLQSPDPLDPRQVAFDLSPSRHWRGEIARIGIRLLVPPDAGQVL